MHSGLTRIVPSATRIVVLVLSTMLVLSPAAATGSPTPVASAPVFVGAGDISSCHNDGDEQTASLLDGIQGTVFTLGDNAYGDGSAENYASCYAPTWGRHRDRTRPVPGNHDYNTPGASGYFNYFGPSVGDPSQGYYSYDLGTWHIIALNSNCEDIGGCGDNSAQVAWLRADLAAHPAQCTLAYEHHPRFSSSKHGNDDELQPIWTVLYDNGADVVLSGHDHVYERFAPQDPTGQSDPDRGIRQFVVGTGGAGLYEFKDIKPNSEVQNNETHGVLKMTLEPGSYTWEFVPVAGSSFTDSGTAPCH